MVIVRVHRQPLHGHGDEFIVGERPIGDFSRQHFLGENLGAGKLTAAFSNGVLLLRIPVAEASKPRMIESPPPWWGSRTIKTGSSEPADAAASVRAMTPSRYEVVADEAVADQAKSLLATMRGVA